MADDLVPTAPQIEAGQEIQLSEIADRWAQNRLSKTEHGWHGMGCQTCQGRYITVAFAFDAGFNAGINYAMEEQTIIEARKAAGG